MIRSKAIKQATKWESCTLEEPGVCNHNPETTVFCHLPDGFKGMGMKANDISGFFGCSNCHGYVDGRDNARFKLTHEGQLHLEKSLYRAVIKTWLRLIELDVITVKS